MNVGFKLLRNRIRLLALILWCILLVACPLPTGASSTLFGGGPFYSGGYATMNTLRASGYTTVMLWCIHVDATTGNLIFNDQLVAANGSYVGNAGWPAQLATLKTAPTSVNRIEIFVSSYGVNDFQSIQTLMNNYGTNTGSILYRNFQALKTATGAAAVDYDDETLYDVATAVKFGRMLSSIGFKVTLCPYMNSGFWQSVYTQLGPTIVDAVYLQCYAGGAGNDPATWNGYFSGTKVQPGLWCRNGSGCSSGNTASEVQTQMASWKSSAGITGGFMWLFDDMLSCNSGGTAADYAKAINQAVDPLQISPSKGFSAIVSRGFDFPPASTSFVLANTSAASLDWSLINTSLWLTVSSANGTLAAQGSTAVSVGLEPAVATNLAPNLYFATVVFSNRSTGVAQGRSFALNTAISNRPVALTGFNTALLAANTAAPANAGATAFDVKNNYCFYQSGLSGSARGLPLNGVFSSLSDSATAFQIGPYGAADALMLGYQYLQSGTLTLKNPQAFDKLIILACSANGGGHGTLMVNFGDGTHSPVFDFNAQDWFNTVTNVALQGFGRLKLGTSFTIEDNGDSNPNLYQTAINLAGLGLTQSVASITFYNPATAGAQQNTAIFAISGRPSNLPVPPPVLSDQWSGGKLTLSWPANGLLLETTNLSGPWTTNGAQSPVVVTPTRPQVFYRVQAR